MDNEWPKQEQQKKIITEKTKTSKKNRRTWTTSSASQPEKKKSRYRNIQPSELTIHFFCFCCFFAVLFCFVSSSILYIFHFGSTKKKKNFFLLVAGFSLYVCFVQKDIRKVFRFRVSRFVVFLPPPTLHISNVFSDDFGFHIEDHHHLCHTQTHHDRPHLYQS